MTTPKQQYGFLTPLASELQYDASTKWISLSLYLYAKTNQLLSDYYAANPADKFNDHIPVPIEKVARWLGFTIKSKSLNLSRHYNLGPVLGRLELVEDTWLISLEQSHFNTIEDERYAIANLLAYYYMSRNSSFYECVKSRFPYDKNDGMISMFTAFLLFPPKDTFRFLEQNINIAVRQLNLEHLLVLLARKANISTFYTSLCFEHLKLLAFSIHQITDLSPFVKDWESEFDKDYLSNLFSTALAPETFFL